MKLKKDTTKPKQVINLIGFTDKLVIPSTARDTIFPSG